MAYGIGSILGDIDQKADMYRNNPEALAQSYQQNQQLIDLLVLQKLKTDKEAAQRDMQAKMQTPAGTIKDQRQAEIMDMTRNEVVQQVSPGLQSLAQQQPPQEEAPAEGIASVPAPTMGQIGMAEGGIIGFQDGDLVEGSKKPIPYARPTREEAIERMLNMDPDDMSLEALAVRDKFLENVSPEEQYTVSMGNPKRALTEEQLARQYAQEMKLIPPGRANTPFTVTPPAVTTAVSPETNATPPVTEKGISTITNADNERNVISMLGEDLPRAPKAEAILAVPTKAVKQAPSEAQSAYTQMLADLRVEQEDKLDSLIAFLQGAGGKTSFAAAMRGGSENVEAREEGIKAEIMDVLGKLETIDLKEREFGLAEEGIAVDREQIAAVKAASERNADMDYSAAMAQIQSNNRNADLDFKASMAVTNANIAEANAGGRGSIEVLLKVAPILNTTRTALQDAYTMASDADKQVITGKIAEIDGRLEEIYQATGFSPMVPPSAGNAVRAEADAIVDGQ